MNQWFVIAKEYLSAAEGGVPYVQAWGPFHNETDARAYAIQAYNENGWEEVEAKFITITEAQDLSTDVVAKAYKED